MAWEELETGLDIQGVALDVGSRTYGKQGGGVGKTRIEMELVMGLDVIQALGAAVTADGITEGFRLRWGSKAHQGTIQLLKMKDQGLPGLEIRTLKKGTEFKLKALRFPTLMDSTRTWDRVQLDWTHDGNGIVEIELPEGFFLDSLPEEENVVDAESSPVRMLEAPKKVSTAAASLAAVQREATKDQLVTIPELEEEARKRIPHFSVNMSGRYYIGEGKNGEEYSLSAVVGMVNQRRARGGLGKMVIS